MASRPTYEQIQEAIAEIKAPDTLEPRQVELCKQYLVDLNQVQAALRAGYSESYAKDRIYKQFQRKDIQDYIAKLQKAVAKRTGANPDEIVRRIMRISEHAEQEGEWNAALRGLELLGRHLAMFTDKQQIETVQNPWATGDDEDSIQQDIEKMRRVAAPKLKVVNGGKEDDGES